MKLKTSAIAMAVAGTLAAPVVVQAGADEVYASARIGLWNQDTAGESEMDIRSFSSRFGARGETDLGNGMTGFGRYEWDVDLGEGGSTSVRHRYVGLKGDFGQVLIGQTTHTFYNHVVGPLDIPWWHSGYNMISYGAANQTSSRGDNAITYSGSTGAITFGITGYFDLDLTRAAGDTSGAEDAVNAYNLALQAEALVPGTFTAAELADLASDATDAINGVGDTGDREDGLDGVEIGVTVGLGDMALGFAMQDIEVNEEEVVGIVLSGISLGDATLGVSFMNQDDDDGIVIDAGLGGFYAHIEQTSRDAADVDPLALTLGYTQSLGRKTTMYYEVFSLDADTSDSDDDVTRVMAVLKYDII
jgi:predicted porin